LLDVYPQFNNEQWLTGYLVGGNIITSNNG